MAITLTDQMAFAPGSGLSFGECSWDRNGRSEEQERFLSAGSGKLKLPHWYSKGKQVSFSC